MDQTDKCDHCKVVPPMALVALPESDNTVQYLQLCYNCHQDYVKYQFCKDRTCSVFRSTDGRRKEKK